MEPGTGRLRVARGALLAILCLVLAASGHTMAGGALPSIAALLVVGGPIGCAFVILADRERGFPAIASAAVVSQVLFHAGFELATYGAHAAYADHAGLGAATGGAVVRFDGMLSAHLAAAGLLAVLARDGETLLWSIAQLVLGSSRIPSPAVAPVRRGPGLPRWGDPRSEPHARVQARIYPGRGPPLRTP